MPLMPDAVVLCGGAGLRLKAVTGDRPKPMAEVAGRPFLERLLNQLRSHGYKRVILAAGYGAAEIQSHFGEAFEGMDIAYSNEISPLGTGGALRNAASLVRSKCCLTMNGDSYTDADLRAFGIAHREWGADLSIVLVPVDGRGDAGSVVVDSSQNIVKFAEKERADSSRYLNAGIYMISRQMLHSIPEERPVSLERQVFPDWISTGRRVKGFVHPGTCMDIGTPERFRVAQQVFNEASAPNRGAGEEDQRV